MRIIVLIGVFVLAMGSGGYAADLVAKTEALSPAEELAKFRLPPGFEAQLVAAEPDINKPMNIAFDARGRLWVTSTVEYPWPAKLGTKPRDAVKVLSDFGHDGRARKITTFADELNIPIGLLPLGAGDSVLVHSIPNIWRMTDTDGDGRADKREIFLTGFGFKDTHGMTNAFTLGFDGWIYACHGFSNDSAVKFPDGTPIKMNSGNTYRFHPDGSRVEQFTWGQVNPFGIALDPLGNLFSADCHSKPITLLLRGAHYQSFGKPQDGLGFAPDICAHDHGSSGIGGVAIYAADNFPTEYRGTAFLGNVVTSRISHDRLEWHGSSPKAIEQPDFLVSDDPWFRPVDIKLGPDGALYVADFYNKIIGHYEVDLKHPGRDRERGRIWRIVYRGDKTTPPPTDRSRATVKELVADLAHPNLTVRLTASHLLVERGAKASEKAIGVVMSPKSSPLARAHALWILERLGVLDEKTLVAAARDADATVRTHAIRLLSERKELSPQLRDLALTTLKDSDAMTRRAAADAVGQHPVSANVQPLLTALASTANDDGQLKHMLRLALRKQFNAQTVAGDTWTKLAVNEREARMVADFAVAVPNVEAAKFLLVHVERFSESQENWMRFARHIARYGGDDTMSKLVGLAQKQFAAAPDRQMELVKAIKQGRDESGRPLGNETQRWAEQLVSANLTTVEASSATWSFVPMGGTTNPWTMQTRHCADGQEAQVLSSFPRGETLMGTLRSPNFSIPKQLSFYLCGHNGMPEQPDHGKNHVRLRAAASHAILAEVKPPRNDIAQKVTWDLGTHAGQQGYLELTDGDNQSAYAWLALGRLEPAVVSLADAGGARTQLRRAAIELAASLRMTPLEGELTRLVVAKETDMETRAAAAQALLAFNSPTARAALLQALQTAPQQLQASLALALASSKEGGEALLTAIGDGKASPQLLLDRAVKERLLASKSNNVAGRIAKLAKDLPAADEQVLKSIAQRNTGFTNAKTDPARGTAVFEKNCAVCHSIGGKGARFAPQLDGIGARGAERLLEDILDPNRNADPAFRTSYLKLNDGRTLIGLILREEGETVVMLNDERQEERIAKGMIQERSLSLFSPMPANIAEQMSESEFYDLLAYLLSQQSKLTGDK